MKAFLLIIIAFCFYGRSYTQNNNSFVVKAGTTVNESVPAGELYEYPEFSNGTVYFYNEPNAEAKMNYHRFLDEMQFIAFNGDTLTVDNEETIRLITIGKDSFYYNKGFIKLLSSNKAGKLGVKHSLKIGEIKKMGAYNTTSSVSSIRSVNAQQLNGGRMVKLLVREDVVLMKEAQYYFGDQFNHFVLANKKAVLQVFSKHADAIKKYLKEHKVSYTSKEDLDKLFQFVATL